MSTKRPSAALTAAAAAGHVRVFTVPDGGSWRYEYDDDGRVVEERDPLGLITHWERTGADDGYSVARTENSGPIKLTVDGSVDDQTAELGSSDIRMRRSG